MDKFQRDVPEEHRFQELDIALSTMPPTWWGRHKNNFANWKECRQMMKLWFGYSNTQIVEKYRGKDDPREHLA